ncbi:MAG TPA: alkyl sulfatase dimerization domain-containing protein [Thermoleophilaceae bacterium]|jgi:alkyl sulfatase BDS1-like metallo-beta-lactamase superfamily hydrolase
MPDMLELADRLWSGEADLAEHHPVGFLGELTEVREGIAFLPSFANVTAVETDEGLVLFDSGSFALAQWAFESIRGWRPDTCVHTVVFTHGHVDHVFGLPLWEEEAVDRGWIPPIVVAHENMPARFDRYRLTAGYNAAINRRQFGVDELEWPLDYRYPDKTYRDELELEIGGERFELHHAKGETDDYTWTWIPGRRTICCGDLFIWAVPNAGNPQKVQRYPREWVQALRAMAELDAELLLPGHGLPVVGAERVRAALEDSAALLESLVEQTLALMNEGAPLDQILHAVRPPANLLEKPYLRPIYDEPEFIVRNLWRQFGGWYDGNPANLKPAPDAALAGELAGLTGGGERLAERALELAEAGELRLAGHLAELAALAEPELEAAQRARAEVNECRAQDASSTMARGVFNAAARESRARLG